MFWAENAMFEHSKVNAELYNLRSSLPSKKFLAVWKKAQKFESWTNLPWKCRSWESQFSKQISFALWELRRRISLSQPWAPVWEFWASSEHNKQLPEDNIAEGSLRLDEQPISSSTEYFSLSFLVLQLTIGFFLQEKALANCNLGYKMLPEGASWVALSIAKLLRKTPT